MSSRIRRSISSATFVCALLVPSLGANAQSTGNCLSAPTSPAPQNSHWYYRTNRTTQRKCWHLGNGDRSLPPSGVQTTRDGATSNPSRSSHAKVSNKETAELYAAFLEWKDRQAGKH
jgi:hypothetical protein